MAKVYDVLFMFNYPHPSGDKRRDVFITPRDAAVVGDLIAPADIERYVNLGYLRETEVDDADAERLAAQREVAIPLTAEEMTAPRIGPGAMPRPLGKSGQKLLARMKDQFAGNEGQTRLLERLAAEDESGATTVDATGDDTSTPGRSGRKNRS